MGCFKKLLRLLRISKKSNKSNATESVINDDDHYNQQKLESQNAEVGSSSNQMLSPSIFNLTVDCYDEIFEYLSLKDLHSIGLTCKQMQKVAGEYFRRNFKWSDKFIHYNGIYTVYSDHEGSMNERTQTSGFNQFIYNISHSSEDLGPLNYIESHSNEFESVGNILLMCTSVGERKAKYFQQILPQIETVRLQQCTGRGDVYEVLLKFCKNLKNLTICDDLGTIINFYKRNEWLYECYPKLEHLTLSPRSSNEIPDLCTFFERNPSVQHFSTTSRFLWMNQDQLLKSCVKLNTLDIEFSAKYGSKLVKLGEFRELFNGMYEKKVYKRLHLTVERINQEFCDELVSLSGIEKLNLNHFNEIYNLHRLTGLRELSLPGGLKANDIEILAVNLVNLEKVCISSITSNDLLPFMRCSGKLQKLYAYLNEDDILNLAKLNKERKKLIDAQKVIIYLNDNNFLATKWSVHNGETDLELAGIRRSSFE